MTRRDQHHSRGVTMVSIALALAIILAAVLVGCGGSGDNPPTDSTGCDNSGTAGARVCTDTKGQSK